VRPGEVAELLGELVEAQNALDSVRLRLLREADRHQLGDATGETSTANWWARLARITRPAAHREVRLAESLDDDDHRSSAEAVAAGEVSVAQAAVILDAVDSLPNGTVDPATRRDVEALLVTHAAEHDPRALRLLGRKALDVIAPEVAEEVERRRLEREEQHAAAAATFTMSPDGHGSVHGRFTIPALAGQMLAKHLDAIAAPKHQRAVSGSDLGRVSRPMKLGSAFTEYVETRGDAPRAGGVAATVVVTMTLADLTGAGDSPATVLDTGETISAGEARRLACEAGIIPAVLGTRSQVLDLGRRTRFHTEPQRVAIALRDRGCSAEGCDWPPGMCHAHHDRPWSHGGSTSVKDGRLLCPRHHVRAHDVRYQMKTTPSGKVLFTLRT
jgi:hypothetical protein